MAYTEYMIIRDLYAMAAGLLAMPALIMHLSAVKGAKRVALYILDAIVVCLMLVSLFY